MFRPRSNVAAGGSTKLMAVRKVRGTGAYRSDVWVGRARDRAVKMCATAGIGLHLSLMDCMMHLVACVSW